jgi:hypothetical protein
MRAKAEEVTGNLPSAGGVNLQGGQMDKVDKVLAGAIDMHVHDTMLEGYRWDVVDLANRAIEAKMGGIILKNTFGSSSEIAYLINHLVGKEIFLGMIVLNRWIGGLNPLAVKDFMKIGAGLKVVSMPTRHALNQLKKIRGGNTANAVLLFDGSKIVPELEEILSIVAQNDLVLATGHISPEESLLLIDEAQKAGVRKILVTHASVIPVTATFDQQKEMSKKGAYIEHVVAGCMPHYLATMKERYGIEVKHNTVHEVIENILGLGIERCVLSTDFGQDYNPDSVEGLRIFIRTLLDYGFTVEQVKVLVEENPKKLLGWKK